jgi:hypothetical protein
MERQEQKASDLYHRRRIITPDQECEVRISDLHIPNSSKVLIIVEIAGEEWGINLSLKNVFKSYKQDEVTSFLENIEFNEFHFKIEDLIDESFSVKFNDSMDEICIGKNSYEILGPDKIPEKTRMNQETISQINQNLPLLYRYKSGDENYIQGKIQNVVQKNKSFRIEVSTGTSKYLNWDLDVPLNTDPDENPVSNLIESVGGGEIGFLDNGRVYIVSSDDVPDSFEDSKIVGQNVKNQKWSLLTKKNFDDLIEYKNKVRESDKTDSKIYNQKNPSLNIGYKYGKMTRRFVFAGIYSIIVGTVGSEYVSSIAIEETNLEIITTIQNITYIFQSIGAVFLITGMFLFIIRPILNSSR